ncbi:MAG: hypothetical protein V1887_02435 [Candidatus Aenigmatarchaeota archaeon]
MAGGPQHEGDEYPPEGEGLGLPKRTRKVKKKLKPTKEEELLEGRYNPNPPPTKAERLLEERHEPVPVAEPAAEEPEEPKKPEKKTLSDLISKYGFGKDIKNRVLPLMVLMLIGGLFMIGTPAIPALGIPAITATYLGVAFVLWGALYLFPTEYDIKKKMMDESTIYECGKCNPRYNGKKPECPGQERGEKGHIVKAVQLEITGEHYGPLYARAVVEVFAIILAMLDLSRLSLLVALVFAFVMYFKMPGSYKQDQPYKAATAWLRTGIGVTIAYLLVTFLSPNATTVFTNTLFTTTGAFIAILFALLLIINVTLEKNTTLKWILTIGLVVGVTSMGWLVSVNEPQLSLMFFALAFYAVTPGRESKEEFEKRTEIKISVTGTGKIGKFLDDRQKQMRWEDFGTAIFISFMMLGGIPMIGSWMAGSGQIQLTLALIWLISIVTGVTGGRTSRPYIGSVMMIFAVFSFSAAYSDTVGTAVFGQYWGYVGAGMDSIFGPLNDAAARGSCEAAASYSCITDGPSMCAQEKLKCEKLTSAPVGSDKSIEFEEITGPQEYDPYMDSTLYFTFTNAGEFDAQNVQLEMPNGPSVIRVEGVQSKTPVSVGSITLDSSSCIGGRLDVDKCVWDGVFKPGARGAGTVTINWKCNEMKLGQEGTNTCGKDQVCDRGLFPEITFRTSYMYNVKSTYAIDVRSADELKRILLDPTAAAQQAGVVSQYSGGPLTASLWTPKYIQSGAQTIVTAGLTNTKDGRAENVDFCIFVPAEATVFNGGAKLDTAGKCGTPPEGTQAVYCDVGSISNARDVDPKTAKPNNYKTCGFRISLDIGSAPQKQLAITGSATYKYVLDTVKKDIPITFVSGTGQTSCP